MERKKKGRRGREFLWVPTFCVTEKPAWPSTSNGLLVGWRGGDKRRVPASCIGRPNNTIGCRHEGNPISYKLNIGKKGRRSNVYLICTSPGTNNAIVNGEGNLALAKRIGRNGALFLHWRVASLSFLSSFLILLLPPSSSFFYPLLRTSRCQVQDGAKEVTEVSGKKKNATNSRQKNGDLCRLSLCSRSNKVK